MFKLESRSKFHMAYEKVKNCSAYSKIVAGSIIDIGNAPAAHNKFKIIKVVKNSIVHSLENAMVAHLVVQVVPYYDCEEHKTVSAAYIKDSEFMFYKIFNNKLRKFPFIKMLAYYSFLRKNVVGHLKLDHDFKDISVPIIQLEFFSNVLNDCFYDDLDMFEFALYSNYVFGKNRPELSENICYLKKFTVPTNPKMFEAFMQDYDQIAKSGSENRIRKQNEYRHLIAARSDALQFSKNFTHLRNDSDFKVVDSLPSISDGSCDHIDILLVAHKYRKELLEFERLSHVFYKVRKDDGKIVAKEQSSADVSIDQICLDGSICW